MTIHNVTPEGASHNTATVISDTKCIRVPCPAREGDGLDRCGDPVTVVVEGEEMRALGVLVPCGYHRLGEGYDTPYTLDDIQRLVDGGKYREVA